MTLNPQTSPGRRVAAWLAPIAALVPILGACGVTIPEASLPPDEPFDTATRRVEFAAGLSFAEAPTVEWRPASEVIETQETSPLDSAVSPPLQSACWDLFVGARHPVPGAARLEVEVGRSPSAFDPVTRNLFLGEGEGTDRRSDLTRTEALALALVDQHLDLAERLDREGTRNDRAEALLAFAAGLACAATLEASTAPVFAFDASAAPLRHRQARFTERLLEDPDGAPAELVTDPDLTSMERLILERILAVSGAERRRRVLRLAAGTRLVLEAKDRLSNGNLSLLVAEPPRSTEQLLHPERYLEQDDPPLTIDVKPRDGLLGPGWAATITDVAGEYGLLLALAGALPHHDAAAAAEGWGGDALTLYRSRDGAGRGLAWRLEFDDRFEATEAARAFRRAITATYGGSFPEVADDLGGWSLVGGQVPASVRQVKTSLVVLLSGVEGHHRVALSRLAGEAVKPVVPHRSGVQDTAFRWFRRLASPILFDQPGRFDALIRAGYGVVFRHRTYPRGGEHWFLNITEFPVLGCLLPEGLSALLFAGEGGAHRRDVGLFWRSVRWFQEHRSGASRFWSPLVSWTSTSEYSAHGIAYGFLWERGEGAGRDVFAPRPLWSKATQLDGADEEWGVLFDAVQWRQWDGVGKRLRLLPFGLLLDATASQATPGVDVRLLREVVRVKSHEVVPGAGRFELSMLGGWLARFRHDDAADRFEDSIARGLLVGVCGDPRGWSFGVGRVGGRSLIGFGGDGGRGFLDLLWFRF